MKKKKLTSILGVLTLSAALFLTGCGGGTSDSGKESESTTSKIAVGEESTVPENVTSAPAETTGSLNAISGGEEAQVDCSFTLEGKSYTLPFDYSQLEADGWKTDTDLNQELQGYTYTFIFIEKEGKEGHLTVDLYNGTGNTKKLKDCKVSEIEVNSRDLENYSFSLANSLKPGDDINTVTTIMGTPTNSNADDHDTTYTYGESRDTGQISFVWFADDAETGEEGEKRITVAYFQKEASLTSNDVPAYLSEYQAPTAMGNDFDSATFTLDGVVYKLPCPTSEFVKNGWTLTESADVPAGRESLDGQMEKNGVKINLHFSNFADYQTSGENCAVSEIEMTAYSDDDPIPNLQLPMNVNCSMKKDALETALAGSSVKFDKNESDTSISYSYDDYKLGTEAYFYYNLDNDRINSLRISGEKWPGK